MEMEVNSLPLLMEIISCEATSYPPAHRLPCQRPTVGIPLLMVDLSGRHLRCFWLSVGKLELQACFLSGLWVCREPK